ncbi:MAG: cobalt transporter, inner rane subunit CbiQ [Eubacterium sp.]|jgi:cobalt/nickel transport system permease protein|nr:cobalt transporter, inner rane subunit CbiQ [Eubacterium sp.]
MADIIGSVLEFKHVDELSKQKNLINNIHPLVKLMLTLIYICTLASFNRYETSGLLPFFLYPTVVIIICDIPVGKIIKRVLMIEPFIIFAGILNPILDRNPVQIGGISLAGGWLTFISLVIKSTLMVTAGFLLIATTGIDDIAKTLSLLKVPSVFVLLFLLTYRYIFVLMDEAGRLMRAYQMRAPQQSGINIKVWGSMVGQLLIRTYNRAQVIYQSMVLKGYRGKYNTFIGKKIKSGDVVYLVIWILFIAVSRVYNIPLLISSLF